MDINLKLVDPTLGTLEVIGKGTFTITPPTPPEPEPDLAEKCWFIDANPARAFGLPSPPSPYNGVAVRMAAQCEKMWEGNVDGPIKIYPTDTLTSVVKPTGVFHTPGLAWVERVMDPLVADRWNYQFSLNKAALEWKGKLQNGVVVPDGDSYRAEVGPTSEDRYLPWGTEEMCVVGLFLPVEWGQIDLSGNPYRGQEWHCLWQWHDAPGGLTGNPAFAVYYNVGGAAAGDSVMSPTLRMGTPGGGNTVVASAPIRNVELGAWHYFVAHYVTGAGGEFSGAKEPFFRLYHCVGEDTPLELTFDYRGVWASPNPVNKNWPGYWKAGLYMKNFFSQLPNRVVRNLGFRQYAVQPGVTPEGVLRNFKGSRR